MGRIFLDSFLCQAGRFILKITGLRMVYHDSDTTDGVFKSPKVGDLSAIATSIGVLSHKIPTNCNFSSKKGVKTFLPDPFREVHGFLGSSQNSSDVLNRSLAGSRIST